MRHFLIVAVLCVFAGSAISQDMSRSSFSEMWNAAFSYHAAARVCGNRDTVEIARNAFQRLMNFGRHHGLLSSAAQKFDREPDRFMRLAEAKYREQKWVSCGQVDHYVRQLDELTRRLP